MNFKSKKFYFIIAAVIVLILAAVLFITNYYYLELNTSKDTITLEYGVDEISNIQFVRKSILDKEINISELEMLHKIDLSFLSIEDEISVAIKNINIRPITNTTIEIIL